MMFKLQSLRFLLVFAFCFYKGLAQQNTDTLKILFVGNSYTHSENMPHLVALISDSTQIKLKTSKSTAPGVKLSHHWKGEMGLKTKELIKNGKFDYVVLQGHSMATINKPDSLKFYAKKFSDFIIEQGSKPFFYVTWAREKVPQFQNTITSIYTEIGQENNAAVVLIGEAWKLAQMIRPNIELYSEDGSHPSRLGAFLTACVFVKTFTKELPEVLQQNYSIKDANGETVRLMYLDELDIQFVIKVVNELTK